MKITSVDVRAIAADHRVASLLVLGTDESVFGIGELASSAHSVATSAVGDLRSMLVGRDPFDVQALTVELLGGSNGAPNDTAVLAAASTAMVDICGQHLGVPAHQFLGGRVRDRVRVCAVDWVGDFSDLDQLAEAAVRTVALGFGALRIGPFSSASRLGDRFGLEPDALVRAVREAVPDTVDLIVGVDRRSVEQLGALADQVARHEPLWLECLLDGTLPPTTDAWRPVAVPLASASATDPGVVQSLIAAGLVDHIALDVGLAGGLHSARRIAAMAEIYHIGIVPSASTPVSLATAVHLAAAIPNLTMVHMRPGLAHVVDGMVDVDLRSGLGIDVISATTMEVA